MAIITFMKERLSSPFPDILSISLNERVRCEQTSQLIELDCIRIKILNPTNFERCQKKNDEKNGINVVRGPIITVLCENEVISAAQREKIYIVLIVIATTPLKTICMRIVDLKLEFRRDKKRDESFVAC